jgi:hypothetical protein
MKHAVEMGLDALNYIQIGSGIQGGFTNNREQVDPINLNLLLLNRESRLKITQADNMTRP